MNLADALLNKEHCKQKLAIVTPKGSLSYDELNALMQQWVAYFHYRQIPQNTKVLFLVKASIHFPALAFACFYYGLIPTFLDPGMGMKNLYKTIKKTQCSYIISTPIILFFSRLLFPFLKNRINYTRKLVNTGNYSPINRDINDCVCIIFTSGGTGTPKPIIYTQGMLESQKNVLQQEFKLTENDKDAAGFPLFSLFTISMGMTSSYLPMNPTKAAKCNGKKVAQWLIDHEITFAAGSPAIWKNVILHTDAQMKFPKLKSLVMFGAPVPLSLHRSWYERFEHSNSHTYTPYGATEALPLSNISGEYILHNTAQLTQSGLGICVGEIIKGNNTEIEIRHFLDSNKKIGEIWVKSNVLTPSASHLHYPWHFMGDLGYFDEQQRLWFCGRKVHAFQDRANHWWFPVMIEAKFLTIVNINRCALIQFKGDAALVIDSSAPIPQEELNLIEGAKDIKHYFYHSSFPLDGRHNIKVDRLLLATFMEQKYA